MSKKKESGGAVGLILSAGVIGALIIFVITGEDKSPKGQALQQMTTPRASMTFYLEAANDAILNRSGSGDILKTVMPRDDYQWFLDNAKHISADPADLRGGLDPGAAGAATIITARHTLLDWGPNHPSNEILDVQESGDTATVKVRKKLEEGHKDFDVRLVKDGKHWKITRWCGARDVFAR